MDFSNLWSHDGFMPMGAGVITVGIVTVIFSMVGAEIATIAAAESANPEKAVAKAANSVILRILLFYVGSVFLLVTIMPWNDDQLALAVRRRIHQDGDSLRRPHHERRRADRGAELPELGDVHGLTHAVRPRRAPRGASTAGPGHAPRRARKGDPRVVGGRVPMRDRRGVLADTVFAFLLNSSGAIILFVYLLIRGGGSCCATATGTPTPAAEDVAVPGVVDPPSTVAMAGDPRTDVYGRRTPVAAAVGACCPGAVVLVLFFANKWFVETPP